jgi:hypothetical protein
MQIIEKSLYESHNFSPSNKLLVFSYTAVKHQTEKAHLLTMYDRDVWLPKSCTKIVKQYKYVTMPVWIAAKKGFIEVLNIQDFGKPEAAMGSFKKAIIYEYKRLVPPCTINFNPKTGGK